MGCGGETVDSIIAGTRGDEEAAERAAAAAERVAVPAGANITVVAHLSASGKPALTPYVNDTSPIAAGQTRLTVRHDAAARLELSASFARRVPQDATAS